MIKVASSVPAQHQQLANGFHPPPPSDMPAPPVPMVFTNPVATAELPEVNEPEKPPPEGEVNEPHSLAGSNGHFTRCTKCAMLYGKEGDLTLL